MARLLADGSRRGRVWAYLEMVECCRWVGRTGMFALFRRTPCFSIQPCLFDAWAGLETQARYSRPSVGLPSASRWFAGEVRGWFELSELVAAGKRSHADCYSRPPEGSANTMML